MYRLFVTIAYRKWLILLITLLIFAVVAGITFMTAPMYKATASFRLAPEATDFLKYPTTGEAFKLNESAFYKTQYEILGSELLAERVIDKLKLTQAQITRQSVLARLGLGAQQPDTVDPLKLQAELMKTFQNQLQVLPVDNSQIVYVSFSCPDKTLAAQVANTFVEEYRRFSIDDYEGNIKQAKEKIIGKINDVRASLQKTEASLQRFTASRDMVVTKDDTNPYIENMVKLDQEVIQAEKDRIVAETELQKSSNSAVSSTNGVLTNQFMQTLKSRLAELQADYQKKLEIYKPDYPAMLQLRQQISETESKLAQETAKFQQNLQLSYEASKKQEAEIKKLMEKSSKKYQTYVANMTTYNELRRDLDVEKALYDSLLTRLKEIDAANGINANNIATLEQASVPQLAYSPNYLVNLSMGGVIALLMGISVAGILDFRDKTVKIREDIQTLLPGQKSALLEKLDQRMLIKASPGETRFLPSRNTLVSLQAGRVRDSLKVLSLLALGEDKRHVAFMHNLLAFFLQRELKVVLLALDEDHAAVKKLFKLNEADSFFIGESVSPIAVNQTNQKNLSISLLKADEVFSVFNRANHFPQLINGLLGSYDLVFILSSDVKMHPEVIPDLDISDMILVNVLKRQTLITDLERLVTQLERLPNSNFCVLHDLET